MLTTIQGYVDVTIRVPFTAVHDAEDETESADFWKDMVNAGTWPDAMEGADVPAPDHTRHEIVDSEIADAWFVTAEHDHATRCCTEHGHHAMPHRGCLLR